MQVAVVSAQCRPQTTFQAHKVTMTATRKSTSMPGVDEGWSEARMVPSKHLSQVDGRQLSECEYGLILSHNAIARWTVAALQQ